MKNSKSESSLELSVSRAAIDLLKSPDFFRMLRKALRSGGLVGEKQNASVLYLVALSSLLDRPLNAIVKGNSSAGKNILVNRVLHLFPKSVIREITSNSKTAWNYGADDFRHRVVYLQERNDAAGAVHPVRLLISEGRLIRTVTVSKGQELSTKTYIAEGPIASISTTTKDRIQIDDETRHISLWVDESEGQTKRIIEHYIDRKTVLTDAELATWREAYRLIDERSKTRIVLPKWFKIIGQQVYAGSVTVRRYFPAFIEACRTVCLLRSFQREFRIASKSQELEISFEDFAITAILMENIFVESLHRVADSVLDVRKAMGEALRINGKSSIDAKELASYMLISEDRAYKMLRNALAAGEIKRANKPERGNAKRFIANQLPRFLPDPNTVLASIPEIPTPIEFCHPLTSERVRMGRTKRAMRVISSDRGLV